MPDALTTITNLINSPPVQLVAGATLFTTVWGFFKAVESVLNEDTKLEIAVWLLGVRTTTQEIAPWQDTFAKVFDRLFGTKHLSLKCFLRSALGGADTGPLDTVENAAADEPGNAQGGVPVGAEAAGGGGAGEREEPGSGRHDAGSERGAG